MIKTDGTLFVIIIILFITFIAVAYKHGEKIAEFISSKGPKMGAFQKMFGALAILFIFICLPFYWRYMWGDLIWKPITESKNFLAILCGFVLIAFIWIVFRLEYFKWKTTLFEITFITVVLAGTAVARYNWPRIKEFTEEIGLIKKEVVPIVPGATESYPLTIQFSDTLFLESGKGQWVKILPSDICCREKIVEGKLVINEYFKKKRLYYFKAGVLEAKITFKIVCKDGIHSKNCPNGYYVEPDQPKKEEFKVIAVEPNQTQELVPPKEKKIFWRLKEEKEKPPQTNNYDTTIYH